MTFPLPFPYLPGDQKTDSFEDRTQQNMDAIAQQLGAQLAKPRLAHGRVAADGTIASAGSGDWSSQWTATGTYKITFSPKFAFAPTVTATGTEPSSAFARPDGSPTTSTVTILTGASTGTNADGAFNFHAIG